MSEPKAYDVTAGGADYLEPLLGITRPEWHALCEDLLELERAGALGGIREVVAERLAQVRSGNPASPLPPWLHGLALEAGDHARAAAWLAAEIDRRRAEILRKFAPPQPWQPGDPA